MSNNLKKDMKYKN